jgi:hypothetical protein
MAQAGSNYTYINSAATTVIGPLASTPGLPTTGRRINFLGMAVNNSPVGTITVKSGAATIGILAIGVPAGTYFYNTETGIEVADLQIVTSAADNVTVFWSNV